MTHLGSSKAIAIVGLAYRLPQGIQDQQQLWQALSLGSNLVSPFDVDSPIHQRFSTTGYYHPNPAEAGKSYSFAAGLLEDIEQFDAPFFNMTPREARHLDPRQRQLIELTWQALEHAGQKPSGLRGSDCAVYVGISGNDYSLPYCNDPSIIGPYTMTGNACSIAANRLSYIYGLQGPSVAIDTACSSSLVALHHACQAIRQEEASSAVVATSSMHLHPLNFVGFAKAHMLSKTGMCRPFDADADGYVRSEGSIVLYLKPLEQAEQDGSPIHAVILGSGINCDGKTSSLPVPDATAQAKLMASVASKCQITVDDIDYLEAHGTGTPIGDPIEAHAIGSALGQKRQCPLPIGSIKGNIGHLEVASGLASVLKLVLSIKHRQLLPTINYHKSNPHIDMTALNLKVVDQLTPIIDSHKPLIMAANSFGFGGSNAHVLLSEYVKKEPCEQNLPVPIKSNSDSVTVLPLVLSAQDKPALLKVAQQISQLLQTQDYYTVASNALAQRDLLKYGMVVTGESAQQITHHLKRVVEEKIAFLDVIEGEKIVDNAPVTLLYTGNGCQWQEMGKELLLNSSVRKVIRIIDGYFNEISRDNSQAISVIKAIETGFDLKETTISQAVLLAVQVGITTYLRQGGLTIARVIGHSVGEVAAAWACGYIDLKLACRIIYARSYAQSMTSQSGKMAALAMNDSSAKVLFDKINVKLEISGINSPAQITVSGCEKDINKLKAHCEKHTLYCQVLAVNYAFHSSQMDSIKPIFIDLLTDYHLPRLQQVDAVEMISSVTKEPVDKTSLTVDYWWRNLRQVVYFSDAVAMALKKGAQLFIEVGGEPQLQSYVHAMMRSEHLSGLVLPTLRRQCEQLQALKVCLYRSYLSGAQFDLSKWLTHSVPYISLPSYPWQRQTYSHQHSQESNDYTKISPSHPLLGHQINLGEYLWHNHLDTQLFPYLKHHGVDGQAIMPASGFVEIALAVCRHRQIEQDNVNNDAAKTFNLHDFTISAPLIFDEKNSQELRIELQDDSHHQKIIIKSRQRHHQNEWQLHASARIISYPFDNELLIAELPSAQNISRQTLYQFAHSIGLEYGTSFQTLSQIKATDNEAQASFFCPESVTLKDYILHPVMLDACFQLGMAIHLVDRKNEDKAMLPMRFGRIRVSGDLSLVTTLQAKLLVRNRRSALGQVMMADKEGRVMAIIEDCHFHSMNFKKQSALQYYQWRMISLQPYEIKPVNMDYLSSLIEQLQKQISKQPSSINQDIEQLIVANLGKREKLLDDYPDKIALLSVLYHKLSLTDKKSLLSDEENEQWCNFLNGDYLAERIMKQLIAYWQVNRCMRVLWIGCSGLTEKLMTLFTSTQIELTLLSSQFDFCLKAWVKKHANIRLLECDIDEIKTLVEERKLFDILILDRSSQQIDSTENCLAQIKTVMSEDGCLLFHDYLSTAETTLLNSHCDGFILPEQQSQQLIEQGWQVTQTAKGAHCYALLAQVKNNNLVIDEFHDRCKSETVEHYVIVCEKASQAELLKIELGERHQQVTVLAIDENSDSTIKDLISSHFSLHYECEIIFIAGSLEESESSINNPMIFQQQLMNLIELVAAIDDLRLNKSQQLTVVTDYAFTLEGVSIQPQHAPLIGLVRTMVNEYDNIDFKLIDSHQNSDESGCILATEILIAQTNEQEVILTRDARMVPRLLPLHDVKIIVTNKAYLSQGVSGLIQNCAWKSLQHEQLIADQIKIQVKACGLNFRDLMLSMQLIPDEAVEHGFFGANLGLEFSGVVIAVGPDVSGLQLGDKVMGFAKNSLASEVVTTQPQLMTVPPEWDYNQAASVPIAFFSAYYSLVHLANVKQGDVVLIHSAAGGVGLAAIQIANHLGARVIATAGNERKRTLLRALGVSHVYDSRNLAFVDGIKKEIGCVDVVLNSLAGDAMEASIGLLKPFGRFLELGKRDYYQNTPIHSRVLRHNIHYYAIDADQLLLHKPLLCSEIFDSLLKLFQSQILQPLPHQIFSATQVHHALHVMQQAKHMGKIVMQFDDDFNVAVNHDKLNQLMLNPNASYLVTGGLSGFGLSTAKSLVEHGARHLILIGKSGKVEDDELLQSIRGRVLTLDTLALDVTDRHQVERLFQQQDHPIKGIIHAATRYQDCFIKEMTSEALQQVLAVKIQGGFNLHHASLACDLDFFVAYSSITTLLGSPRQGNYVAANAYLESLMQWRRQQGLPGLAISWGAIDSGMVKRDARLKKLFQSSGIKPMNVDVALDELMTLIASQNDCLVVADINWASLYHQLPIMKHARFDWLRNSLPSLQSQFELMEFESKIAGKSDDEIIAIISQMLAEEISQILCVPVRKIDVNQSLLNLGLDSLMGYELVQSIQQRFNVTVPLMTFVQGPSISQVAKKVVAQLR